MDGMPVDLAALHSWVEAGLMWIGFGVVCGLAAKAILPGRDPGGAVVTILLGMGGALIGSGVFTLWSGNRVKDLISPIGFIVAIVGAIVLLVAHRLLSGRIGGGIPVIEESVIPAPMYTRRRRRVLRTDID